MHYTILVDAVYLILYYDTIYGLYPLLACPSRCKSALNYSAPIAAKPHLVTRLTRRSTSLQDVTKAIPQLEVTTPCHASLQNLKLGKKQNFTDIICINE